MRRSPSAGIVAVRHARLALGIPFPDGQAIVADQEFGEGEAPDLLEGAPVRRRQSQQQAYPWPSLWLMFPLALSTTRPLSSTKRER